MEFIRAVIPTIIFIWCNVMYSLCIIYFIDFTIIFACSTIFNINRVSPARLEIANFFFFFVDKMRK